MPGSGHRDAGWIDLRPAAGILLALCASFAAVEAAAQLPDDETLWQPRVESPEDGVFLAPFVSASFLRSLQEILAEIQIIQERTSGIYFDRKTQLVWTARDNGRDIDWRRARQYCADLELAGFDDWRLPILGELEDIMDPMSNSGYSTPLGINLSACCIWSATRKDDDGAWNFNFRFSKRFSGSLTHTYDLRALCVRAWRSEDGWIPGEEQAEPLPR